ncbi:hypothetical protein D030_4917B, partial [Vibrio parahaemolyticus AQ3810]
VSILRIYRFLG